jgi:hypothetical protein
MVASEDFLHSLIVECKPILELLHQMSEEVLSIILGFSRNGFL